MKQNYEEALETFNTTQLIQEQLNDINDEFIKITMNANITAAERVILMTPLIKKSNELRQRLMNVFIETGDSIYDDAIKKLKDGLLGHDIATNM